MTRTRTIEKTLLETTIVTRRRYRYSFTSLGNI